MFFYMFNPTETLINNGNFSNTYFFLDFYLILPHRHSSLWCGICTFGSYKQRRNFSCLSFCFSVMFILSVGSTSLLFPRWYSKDFIVLTKFCMSYHLNQHDFPGVFIRNMAFALIIPLDVLLSLYYPTQVPAYFPLKDK